MATKHGMFGTPIYGVWSNMLARCRNPRHRSFKNYGGRGIAVCDRWLKFEEFFSDMGPTYRPGLDLDREKNQLGYCPSNCRWVTRTESIRNRRNTKLVEFEGRIQKLAELAERFGLPAKNVNARLFKGWDLHRALTEPIKERR